MIDAKRVIEIAERQLEGGDMFVVECKVTPMGEIESLPFWEKGVRFFKVLDPNNAPVEFCQIL